MPEGTSFEILVSRKGTFTVPQVSPKADICPKTYFEFKAVLQFTVPKLNNRDFRFYD